MTDRYLAGAAGSCPAFADDVSGDGDCQADGAEADPASACVELGSQEGGAPVCYYYLCRVRQGPCFRADLGYPACACEQYRLVGFKQ